MQLCSNFQQAGNRWPCSNIGWNHLRSNQHWKAQTWHTEAWFPAECVNVNVPWKCSGAVQHRCLFLAKLYFPEAMAGMCRAMLGRVCVLVFTAQAVCTVPLPEHVHTGTASHHAHDHLKPRGCCGLTTSQSVLCSKWDVQNLLHYFFPRGDVWQDDRQFAGVPWGAVFLSNSASGRGVCVPGDNCPFYL